MSFGFLENSCMQSPFISYRMIHSNRGHQNFPHMKKICTSHVQIIGEIVTSALSANLHHFTIMQISHDFMTE